MNDNDLNRAVARATGETVSYIRQMGFSLHVVPTKRAPRRPGAQARSRPRSFAWSSFCRSVRAAA
jgi:hypothetical protein